MCDKNFNIKIKILFSGCFLFLFFYAFSIDEIVQENKIPSITAENNSALKKIAVLSDKESVLLFYEYFGGRFLKYHIYFALFLYAWKLMFDKTFQINPKYAKNLNKYQKVIGPFVGGSTIAAVFFITYITKLPICEKQHGEFFLLLLYWAHLFENVCLVAVEIDSFVDYFKKFDSIDLCLEKKNNWKDFKKYFQFYEDDKCRKIIYEIINCKCDDTTCICKNTDHLKEIIEGRSKDLFYCSDIEKLFSKNFSDDLKLHVFNKHMSHCTNHSQCHEKPLYYLFSLNTQKARENLVLFYKELLQKNIDSKWCIDLEDFLNPSKLDGYLQLAKERELDFYNDIFVIIKDLIKIKLVQIPLEKNIFHEFFSAIEYLAIQDSDRKYLKNMFQEGEALLFDICKDLFQLAKEIEQDEAKLFIENEDGYTPLEALLKYFFSSYKQKLFEYIVENSTINVTSFFKHFLLKLSKKTNFFNWNLDLIKYIISHEFDINAVDETGNTVMHYYMRNNTPTENTLQCFIDRGCNLNIKNNDGFYPLDYVDNTTSVFYFLTSKGAVGNKASILFKIKDFLNLEKQNKNIFIESLIDHLVKKDVKMNVRAVLDSIYPDFIHDEHSRDNNDAIVFSCMQYPLENNNDDAKKIIDELSILHYCMLELCQNSNKYQINGIFGGYSPGFYGEWLLRIVQKRFEYNTEENFSKIHKIDTIFYWFLKSQFPCDFTRSCESGQNVFHKISYGGLVYYFESIFEAYKDRSTKNMYDALQEKGQNEQFSKNKSLDPFTLIKNQKNQSPQVPEYAQLYEEMQKSIEYLKNKLH